MLNLKRIKELKGQPLTFEAIKELREMGLAYRQIADEFGLSRQRVHQIFIPEYQKVYQKLPKVKAYKKAYAQRPEVKAHRKDYRRAYYQKIKQALKEYNERHLGEGQ